MAKLVQIGGEEPDLKSEADVRPILDDMEQASYVLTNMKRGERRRRPSAPFTTSTLQQDSSRRLRFSARRTMSLAQQLYEGIDLGDGGAVGLITYMRTDSTHVAASAQKEAREYILRHHGKEFIPPEPPKYRPKSKRAQEAHEAIRPTSVQRTPTAVKKHLSRDQFRLYKLIWNRFVASQMTAAIYNTLSVEVTGRSPSSVYLLRASGSTVRFPGFLVLYEEALGENQSPENGDEALFAAKLRVDQTLNLLRLIPEQHYTQPPPRYSEATLVRALEENGIGRPSTYAPILGTLQNRGYVLREKRRLIPTETGKIVNDLLTEYFPDIVDVNFTARMEADLDHVASGNKAWVDLVREFYEPFSEKVDHAHEEMPEVKAEPEMIGRSCPECGNELVLRWGRHGKFIGCSNFPECRHTEPWLERIGVTCPLDGGELVERRTRKGRIFYGCSNYPECDFSSWKRPLASPCPNCGGLLVVSNKQEAECIQCENRYALDVVVPEPSGDAVA